LDKLGSFPIFTFESPKDPRVTVDSEFIGQNGWHPYGVKLDLILAKSSLENYVSCTSKAPAE
jgi:hypothetical protein